MSQNSVFIVWVKGFDEHRKVGQHQEGQNVSLCFQLFKDLDWIGLADDKLMRYTILAQLHTASSVHRPQHYNNVALDSYYQRCGFLLVPKSGSRGGFMTNETHTQIQYHNTSCDAKSHHCCVCELCSLCILCFCLLAFIWKYPEPLSQPRPCIPCHFHCDLGRECVNKWCVSRSNCDSSGEGVGTSRSRSLLFSCAG